MAALNKEKSKKGKSQIFLVVGIAALVLIVATVAIFEVFFGDSMSDKEKQAYQKQLEAEIQSSAQEAKKLREEMNISLAGNYQSYGYQPESVITLSDDGKASMEASDEKGWWTSAKKENTEFVSLGFSSNENPMLLYVYQNYLIDLQNAFYMGEIPEGNKVNAELSSADGVMKLTLKTDGTVSGIYDNRDSAQAKSDASQEIRTVYSGTYTIDQKHMTVVLNGEKQEFLICDKGIAGFYFEKQQ